jgi:dihydrofolate reductase
MGELTLTTFLTLDGVMQAPGGPEEDTAGGFAYGGWVFPYADAGMGTIVAGIFAQAGGFLLGRTTYDIFAAHWPRVTDADDPVATRLNRLPKFVASRSRREHSWGPVTAVPDVVAQVPAIKAGVVGELQVHGSAGLVQTLIAHDLVDEYRLLTFPVVVGAGKRLFGDGAVPASLRLVETRTTDAGVAYAVYRRDGALRTGSFALE